MLDILTAERQARAPTWNKKGLPINIAQAFAINGARARIRTGDLPLRRRLLYPAELQARKEHELTVPTH